MNGSTGGSVEVIGITAGQRGSSVAVARISLASTNSRDRSLSLTPAGGASARSQPTGKVVGTITVCTEATPAFNESPATSSPYRAPGSSASGHTTTCRPVRGVQSAFLAALAPPDEVTITYSGNRLPAATAAFSPSTTRTRAAGREASRSRPYRGRGSEKPL